MLRFITTLLLLSTLFVTIGCQNLPIATENPDVTAVVGGEGLVVTADSDAYPAETAADDAYPAVEEEAIAQVETAEPPTSTEASADEPGPSAADEATPTPTATLAKPTAEPTSNAPTPVSPRPSEDGTVIETPVAEPLSYTVQRGDTFSQIAEQFGISSYDLAVHNSIFDPNDIEVGQVIEIPAESAASAEPTPDPTAAPTEVAEEPTPAPTETALAEEPTPEPTEVAEVLVEPTPEPTESAEPNTESVAENSAEARTYVVQPGDSLTQLARDFGVPLAELAAANDLRVTSNLIIGQILIIPGEASAETGGETEGAASAEEAEPTTYVVQRGDTLREIAIAFGVTEQAILEANNLSNPNRILVGQTLIIPASE